MKTLVSHREWVTGRIVTRWDTGLVEGPWSGSRGTHCDEAQDLESPKLEIVLPFSGDVPASQ